MPIKTTKIKATSSETSSTIEFLEGVKASPKTRKAIKSEVAEFIKDTTLEAVSKAKSPVKGESFRPLSDKYKALKVAAGGSSKADMELTGDMLDSLNDRHTKNGVKIGYFGNNAAKADSHNKFSGKPSNNPKRRSLPGVGQSYNTDITKGINDIINDHLVSDRKPRKSILREINNKADLKRFLRQQYPQLSVNEAKQAIFRDDELVALFSEFDLLDLF